MKTSIIHLYARELDKLTFEIEHYKDEASLWKVTPEISNSGGNLCLHLIGNLHHFIGKYIGNTNYIRKRDEEFSAKNVPKSTLLAEIAMVKETVITAIENFDASLLQENYAIEKNGEIVTNEFLLLHLITHLSYHIGQINYHRRLLDVLDC